jgi:hypothetical protein
MTQQHLIGELSLLLARLQATATTEISVREIACLRREVETASLTALTEETVRALQLVDDLCWDSLARGDSAAFARQARICAQLGEFGVAAGLLEED